MSISHRPYLARPGMAEAVAELECTIAAAYPGAAFLHVVGEDPDGLYIEAAVSTDDLDDVTDLIVGRLVELQVEHLLPLYVIPVQASAGGSGTTRTARSPDTPNLRSA